MADKPPFNPQGQFQIGDVGEQKSHPKFDPNQPFHAVPETMMDQATSPEYLSTLGKTALKGFGYLGGLGRTAVAQGSDIVDQAMGGGESGKPTQLVKPGEWGKAFRGEAPSTDEYLGRMGFQDSPARNAVGLIGDMALDPLTHAPVSGVSPNLVSKGLVKIGDHFEKIKDVVGNVVSLAELAAGQHGRAAEAYVVGKVLDNPLIAGLVKKGIIKVGKSGLVDSAIRSGISQSVKDSKDEDKK